MSRLLSGRGLFLVLLGLWFHEPVEAQDGPTSSLRAFVSVGGGWGWARGALGVGYVDGEQVTPVSPGEEPSTSAFGVAAQAGVAWTPSPWLGLGLTGLGNLNDFRSFGAVTLSVHLGRTR